MICECVFVYVCMRERGRERAKHAVKLAYALPCVGIRLITNCVYVLELVGMCVWRSDAVVDPGANPLEHTHSSSKHTQRAQTKSCVCEGTFSMCVMSAGDREEETIISRLCVSVGLSPDTRRLLSDPPGYRRLL